MRELLLVGAAIVWPVILKLSLGPDERRAWFAALRQLMGGRNG